MGGGRLAFLRRRRKYRRCCAFLDSDVMLVVQVRSSEMCTPRNLILLTLSSQAVDGQWEVINRISPEIHHNLLCFAYIKEQVVCTTPFNQLFHFLSVECFIIVADETYHSCVIRKLDDMVGAELGSTVVGQQCEEQRAEHTSLWGTRAQCGSARRAAANTN